MIGQSSIIKRYIDGFRSIEPSVVLIGPKGSGKKTLLNTIAYMANTDIIHIPKVITDEIKYELYTYPTRAILSIDLTDNVQFKQMVAAQNSILKFIEDMPSNFRLFILVEDESYLLDTILNRCYIQPLEPYTKRELNLIAKDYNMTSISEYSDIEFEYINYPRDVLLNIPVTILHDMDNLVDTVLTSIVKANISNTLSIIRKLKFDDNEGIYDINIFMNIFNYKIVNILKSNYDSRYFDVFILLKDLRYNILRSNVNKVQLIEKFLLDIKYIL